MRYLMITLGYGNIAAVPVTDPAQTGALVAALSQAALVKREGYSSDAKYIEDEGSVQVEFVDASRVVIGDQTAVLRAKLEATEKELSSTRGYWTQEQAKTKQLREQLEGKTAAA